MPNRTVFLSAARGLNAVAWGLALAFLGGTDIDHLMPLCAGAALSDGLLAMALPSPAGGSGAARRWLAGGVSLAFGALMAWQPLYSTLSYSFLLMLRWVQWLLALGLLALVSAGADAERRPFGPRALGGAVALAAAVALQLWPGAGMVERGLAAGLALALWGAAEIAAAGRPRA